MAGVSSGRRADPVQHGSASRRRSQRRLAAIAVAAMLLASACGRDDVKTADDDGEPAATTTTAAPASGGAGEFGDLGAVCGPAPEGETLGATDVGVTADAIQIGTVSDPGFSGRPGLNQELFDTAEAFTEWCNEAGGINGRRIELKERDAKLTEHQARMIDACEQGDFMLVGGGGVMDDQGQAERLACALPQFPGYAVTAAAVESDLTVGVVPNPTSQLSLGELLWLGEQFPEAKEAVGLLVLGTSATIAIAERVEDALDQMGWKVVYNQQYNPAGEVSWRPYAEGLRSAGARAVIWTGEPVNLASVVKAMDEIEYHPDFVRVDANHYDDLLLSEGRAAVENVYVRGAIYPFLDPEMAEQNPATQQYLDVMDEYDPGSKIAYLGVQGFSAWLLFAKAAGECGAELTRDCVWEKAKSVDLWTGGGLHAPQNLSTGEASPCFVLTKPEGGKFVLPDIGADEGIYRCVEEGVIDTPGDEGDGVKCPNPEFATDPKPSTCAA